VEQLGAGSGAEGVETLAESPRPWESRIDVELFAHVDARPELIAWRQGSCLPYGDGITFWALGEIVKAHAGIWSQMQSM
jgi:hypothetical protein